MQKSEADRIIQDYIKPLYGFSVNKMSDINIAEELASRIILEVYKVLLRQDNIANINNINSYIFKIAHNVWVHFIDEKYKIGACKACELAETIPHEDDFIKTLENSETYGLLRREIAYLSKLQRKILVMYYFENKKVKGISMHLDIPENTVKWHLSCARKEIKIGMDTIRTIGNLGVNPIKFTSMGHWGYAGKLGDTRDFLSKSLAQNIAYAAYHQPLTIKEIAEELGVNPIFVEDEVLYLEEYGYLDKLTGDKYRTNIWITENTEENLALFDEIGKKYSKLFAESFFKDVLTSITEIPDWISVPDNDINILKWSMIPFLSDRLSTADISDTKYAVKRKDGGEFVAMATVETEGDIWDKYGACGGMWRNDMFQNPDPEYHLNQHEYQKFRWKSWQLNHYWTSREFDWRDNLDDDYSKLYYYLNGQLPEAEVNAKSYQRLLDKGYVIKTADGYKCNIICAESIDKWFELFPIADEITQKYAKEYAEAELKATLINQPKHMHEIIKYYKQNCACNLHTRIMEHLLEIGILTMPTDEQKKGLCTVLFLG